MEVLLQLLSGGADAVLLYFAYLLFRLERRVLKLELQTNWGGKNETMV